MIDTLQKMSGTTHRTYKDSKTVTRDLERLFMPNEGKVSYTMSTKEEAVIKFNDMAFIDERNSIVFRAGDPPIWNRNQMILPMSYKLFDNDIIHPGHDYTLQTIPTLSTAIEFDVRQNQPDFMVMLAKRLDQAEHADDVKAAYKRAYNYEDIDIERLDPDDYSDEVMDAINRVRYGTVFTPEETGEDLPEEDGPFPDFDEEMARKMRLSSTENEDFSEIAAVIESNRKIRDKKIFAKNMISKDDLLRLQDLTKMGTHEEDSNVVPIHSYDMDIIHSYLEVTSYFASDPEFSIRDGNLYSDSGTAYITRNSDIKKDMEIIEKSSEDPALRTFTEDTGDKDDDSMTPVNNYTVHDDFIRYLGNLSSWKDIAGGRFEDEMAKRLKNEDI